MKQQLTISECCEMISELAGDIDGICPSCHKSIFPGYKYCPNCGQKLDWE